MPVSRLERERAQRISRPFPAGESYLHVVGRVAGFLEELARDWDRARVLLVGHAATRWALDHLLAGAALPELVVAPFGWQEGWSYALPAGGSDPAWRSAQPTRSSSTVERSSRSSSSNSCRRPPAWGTGGSPGSCASARRWAA
jgi:broad specificity phosphatase PhoE